MNERILELALEAGFSPFDALSGTVDNFANLLIRECTRIVRNANLSGVEGGDHAVLNAASQQVNQHFGIEQ